MFEESNGINIFRISKNNCCFPYDENFFFSWTSSFYHPDGSKKITFDDAFQLSQLKQIQWSFQFHKSLVTRLNLQNQKKFDSAHFFSQSSTFSNSNDFD